MAGVLGLTIAAAPDALAYAQASVSSFAQDSQSPGSPSVGPLTDGRQADNPPLVQANISATAGASTAQAQAQVNGLTGAMTALVSTAVAADQYRPGRNASARATLALTGDIGLAGGSTGTATFTAVLEGSTRTAYSLMPTGATPFDDTVDITYSLGIGTAPQANGALHYACCANDLFSVPFSFTQTVNPGDRISFDFYLQATTNSLQGSAGVDLSHTFKLTGISLPAGMSYTAGSGGFLSQFASPVPEPGSAALLALGLALGSAPAVLAGRRRT